MKLVIAPEPAPWVAPLLESMNCADVALVAPWASGAIAGLRPLTLPGWRVLRAVGRRAGAVLGGGADLALGLRIRQAVDEAVAALLPRTVRAVFAPSIGAHRVFARTPRAEHVLLMDLPVLRQLHADLDDAAEVLPRATFLENYRAPRALLVRQEEELVLASRVLVTSRYARQRLRSRGVPPARLGVLSMPARALQLTPAPASPNVLLAGTTASRCGLELALEAIEQTRELVLWARRGPGSSAAALRHPRLRLVEGAPPPVRCVVAPSWVEAHAPEAAAAVAVGVPLLATERALGFAEQGRAVTLMRPGDVARLRDFLETSGPPHRGTGSSPPTAHPAAPHDSQPPTGNMGSSRLGYSARSRPPAPPSQAQKCTDSRRG
ncbi:MAG: hypothetical protein JNJ54_35915 [Myxococcaceae bacterium]|nr:hypothetical protein [Myxococcaceae bacterium]